MIARQGSARATVVLTSVCFCYYATVKKPNPALPWQTLPHMGPLLGLVQEKGKSQKVPLKNSPLHGFSMAPARDPLQFPQKAFIVECLESSQIEPVHFQISSLMLQIVMLRPKLEDHDTRAPKVAGKPRGRAQVKKQAF